MAAKRPTRPRRERGTGTIQRQRDGSYIARTTHRERSGRFPDRPTAEEALARWNAQVDRGSNPNAGRQTLRDFIRAWLVEVVTPNCRPRTLEFYTRHAGYATAILGDLALEAVTPRAIESCLRVLAANLSPRSVDHVRAVLHNALAVAKRWYRLENPCADVPHRKVARRGEQAMSAAQVALLLAAVEDDRLSCLYHLALTLGLRRGELLGLRWADVDAAHGLLSVTQQVSEIAGRKIAVVPYTKSDDGARALPLTPDLLARLHARQQEDAQEAQVVQQRATAKAEAAGAPIPLVQWNTHGLIFCSEAGTPIQPSNFNRRFASLVKSLGFVGVTPHTMRHTALTDLAAHGEAKAVQSIAGHADIETTMNLYAGRRMTAMRAAVEEMERGRKTG